MAIFVHMLVYIFAIATLFISRCNADLVFTETPSDTVVVLGQSTVFHCAAYDDLGIGTVFVKWYFNNVLISTGGARFHVFSNGTLYLATTLSGDEGSYKCTARIEDSLGGVSDEQTPTPASLTFAFLNDIFYHPSNVTVIDFQTVPAYFQCITGDSLPLATISWETDGWPVVDDDVNVVIYSSRFGDQNSLKVSGTLQINNVRPVNAGQYRCVVTNPLFPDQPIRSQVVTLTVQPNAGEPYISQAPTSQIVPAGLSATFPCVILGDPAPSITWRQVGAAVDIVNSTQTQILDDGSLRFPSVGLSQEGSYVCTGRSRLGSVSTPSVSLFAASMEWAFVTEPTNLDILQGSPATLFCRAPISRPAANVTWYKNALLYSPRTGATILAEGDLYFSAVMKADEGEYFCVASNDFIPQQVTSRPATLKVAVGANIVTLPNATSAVLGNELSLSCQAEGDPTPTIKWYKDERLLEADERTTIGSNGLLHIRNIVAIDEGTYKCEASNSFNTATASAFVNILIPPQITSSPGEVTVAEGSKATLTCTVIGDPAPEVTWYKEDALLEVNTTTPTYMQTNAGLVINEVRREHAGSYRCLAESDVGMAEATGTLVIWTAPEISVRPENQTVQEHMVITFQCNATGGPTPTISWLFNDGDLPTWVSVDEEGRRLNIADTPAVSAGIYTCKATNTQGSVTVDAFLDVLVEPEVTTQPNKTLLASQELIVPCWASGNPSPTFTWLRGPDPLRSRGRVTINEIDYHSVLTIMDLSKSDQGWYSCVASNTVGIGRESFYLTVIDIPGQPTILQATPLSHTSASLVWIAGGDVADTTHFQIQYRLSSSLTWLTYVDNLEAVPGNQTYTLNSLEENREYYLRVVAKNAVGQTPSTPGIVITPAVTGPSAPRSFRVTSWNGTSISLIWEVPADRNGPIEIYIVEYYKTNTSDFMVLEIPGSGLPTVSTMVNSLRPLTSYQLRVSATTLYNGQRQLGNHTEFIEQTTSSAAPDDAPTNVTLVAASATTIAATWSPILKSNQNGEITGYKLLYRKFGGDFTPKEVTGSAAFDLLTDLSPWTTYEIKVQGVNSDGVGPFSDIVSTKTLADAPSSAPQNVALSTLNQTSISITWELVPETHRNGPIDGFTVLYKAASASNFVEVSLNSSEISLIITDLNLAEIYTVQVLAFNLVNGERKNGPKSANQSVSTADGIPGPVNGLTAVQEPTSIRLRWNPPTITNGMIQGYAIKYVIVQQDELGMETLDSLPFFPPLEGITGISSGSQNRSRRQTVSTFQNETHGIIETTETSYTLMGLLPESRYWVGVIARTSAGFSTSVLSIYAITGTRPPTSEPTTPVITAPLVTTNATTVGSGLESFFNLFNLPKTSLILFLSIIGVGFLAIVLAIAVFSAWCSGRRHPHRVKRKATLLIPNDGRSSPGGSMPSDDVIMAGHVNSMSHSASGSHSPSASSGLANSSADLQTARAMPIMDSQPLIHDSDDSHHSDPTRPRASSSPASAQLSVRAIPPPLTLPATASVNLYPTAPNPRNGRLNQHNGLLDTSPAGLEALYTRVNRSNLQPPSRLKKDSLAAIAVLLDQEENESDLRPLDSPPSVVISNQRTTL